MVRERWIGWKQRVQIGRNELRGEAILHRLRPGAAEIDVEVARNPHEIAHVDSSGSPALAEPHRGFEVGCVVIASDRRAMPAPVDVEAWSSAYREREMAADKDHAGGYPPTVASHAIAEEQNGASA